MSALEVYSLEVYYGVVDACERDRHFMTRDPDTHVWACDFCSYTFVREAA